MGQGWDSAAEHRGEGLINLTGQSPRRAEENIVKPSVSNPDDVAAE